MKWMDEAWRHVGVHEIAGEAACPEIVQFFHDSGRGDVASDEVPWCAAFVGACLSRAGIALDAIPKDARLLARSYLKFGTPIDEPRVGAIVVFDRPGGGPGAAHVAFVAGVTADHIQALGGNQANSVNVTAFPRSRVKGYVWPAPAASPADLARQGSRIAAASNRQVRDGAKVGATQLPPAPKLEPEVVTAKMQAAKGWLETAEAFGAFAVSKWPLIVGAAAAFWIGRLAWDAWVIRQARTEDHNTGKSVVSAAGAPDASSV